jgi:hypothetical protein
MLLDDGIDDDDDAGLNGALYFVDMDSDGGSSRFPGDKAGAQYGTGYCDAQCPRDVKFINGEANILNWTSQTGGGHYGTCCHEMDIWESNKARRSLADNDQAVPFRQLEPPPPSPPSCF